MQLIEELLSQLDENFFLGLRYTVLDGKKAYFQGVKSIETLEEEKIILVCGKKRFEVSGSNLTVLRFEEGDLVISGDVVRVERLQ